MPAPQRRHAPAPAVRALSPGPRPPPTPRVRCADAGPSLLTPTSRSVDRGAWPTLPRGDGRVDRLRPARCTAPRLEPAADQSRLRAGRPGVVAPAAATGRTSPADQEAAGPRRASGRAARLAYRGGRPGTDRAPPRTPRPPRREPATSPPRPALGIGARRFL